MSTATKPATTSKVLAIPSHAKSNGHKPSEQYIIPLADDAESQPFQTIDITKIDAGADQALTDDLHNLVSSIVDVGLLNPITVVQHGKHRYRLIAGRHRLVACKQLGWTSIPAHIVSFDPCALAQQRPAARGPRRARRHHWRTQGRRGAKKCVCLAYPSV